MRTRIDLIVLGSIFNLANLSYAGKLVDTLLVYQLDENGRKYVNPSHLNVIWFQTNDYLNIPVKVGGLNISSLFIFKGKLKVRVLKCIYWQGLKNINSG